MSGSNRFYRCHINLPITAFKLHEVFPPPPLELSNLVFSSYEGFLPSFESAV